jgi:hypothetical protein
MEFMIKPISCTSFPKNMEQNTKVVLPVGAMDTKTLNSLRGFQIEGSVSLWR